MKNVARGQIRQVIRQTLAADFACVPEDFLQGIHVAVAEQRPGRRRFPWRVKSLGMATMGGGVVVSASEDRVSWLRETLTGLTPDEVFSPGLVRQLSRLVEIDRQTLVGPQLKFTVSRNDLRETNPLDGVTIQVIDGDAVKELPHEAFRNALGRRDNPERPGVNLAVVARERGEIIGVAGASADGDSLWQIGVDVASAARGRGVGRSVVGRLAGEILARGKVPYYSTAMGNVASQALAVAVGFWPAWVELYAVDPPTRAQLGADPTRANVDGAPTLSDGVILLDGYTMADVEAQVNGEDEEFARRFGWYPERSTPKTVGDHILKTRNNWRDGAPRRAFAARDAVTRELVGGCELRLQGDGVAHMSWWTLAPYRRRGFAARAVRLATRYAFTHLGVERIEAYVESDNLGSRGVARSAGFAEEGILRRSSLIRGARRDMVVYGLLAEETKAP